MRKSRNTQLLLVFYHILLIIFLFPGIAVAGPGGIIARPLGLLAWIVLIICFPFYIYVVTKENLASRRAKKALKQLATINHNFRWSIINERVHAIVTHVYSAWNKTDIERAKDLMTDWYLQNQRMTVLEEWAEQRLKNYCVLKNINYIKPLYIEYYEDQVGDGEGSRLSLLIEVNVKDYLQNEESGKVVEGKKKFVDFETVWTVTLEGGKWKLSLIEDSSLSLEYAKMENDIEMACDHLINNLGKKTV